MNWMLMPLKRYADFQGRSRRLEYWMWVVFQIIVSIVVGIVGGILFGASAPTVIDPNDPQAGAAMMASMSGLLLLYCLVGLAFLIPSLAVTVRRLHDQDKSGWLLLIAFIPLIGGLVLLVFMLLEGTRGPNRYGPDPKDPGAAEI